MTAIDVIDLYTKLEDRGIKIWIDGGWAVDALLGEQTREHQDLDIAIERKDISSLKEYLADLGFEEIKRDEDKMWDMVLKDKFGKEIEVHAFDIDLNKNIVEEDDWGGYSAGSLKGMGMIDGHRVRSVSLDQLIKTHNKNKRTLKEKDMLDMEALSTHFGIIFL